MQLGLSGELSKESIPFVPSKYGEVGTGLIHIHHITPLSEVSERYEVNPKKDLLPVCPNCHAMIHRKRPAYSIEEVRKFIEKAKAEQQ